LSLPLIELALNALGVSWWFGAALALVGIGATVLAGWRLFGGALRDLNAIGAAIEATASDQREGAVDVYSADEVGQLAEAVRRLRERLTVMNQLLIKSLRIESLNMLGSILAHDMKNLSFRLRCLSQNLNDNYDNPEFRESLVWTLNDTTQQMEQMVRRFREQKETVIVKLRINLNEVVRSALDPQALIEIADSGTGMPEEFIKGELFAPFVTTKQHGLGLGLYTCQQIIRMHGGSVRVYSELGRGTVFSIYLPVTD
jgi:signal transduction histidine kinase